MRKDSDYKEKQKELKKARKAARKERREYIKGYMHYGFAVGMAAVFALYCSGRVGWFLVLMLLLAPVVSLAYVLIFRIRGAVTWEAELQGDTLNKGEQCKLIFRMHNHTFLPTPTLRVEFFGLPAITVAEPVVYLSVMPRQTTEVSAVCTGKLSGTTMIGVTAVELCGFFGTGNIDLFDNEVLQGSNRHVGIVPEIAELTSEGEYIRAVSQAALGNDDSEDTLETVNYTFGGFPGYEHRVYQPGDPIKRINWKLSAGREELFVRLDETRAGSGVAIVLDPCIMTWGTDVVGAKSRTYEAYEDDLELDAYLQQDTLELALGFMRQLLAKDLAVLFCYWKPLEKTWEYVQVADESNLKQLTAQLAYYFFTKSSDISRIPDVITSGEAGINAMLYLTPCLDAELANQLADMNRGEDFTAALYVTLTEGGSLL